MIILELIDELIEAFLQGDNEYSYAFNMKTKEVLLDASESLTGEPGIDWDDGDTTENLVVIPQISSSEAYEIMVNFAKKQEPDISAELLDVLNGKKPFRSFKDKLSDRGIGDKWYAFENDYAKRIMTEWLQAI